MYQRIGKQAFKKDLTNIISLCEHLDNPQDQFKSIHIAGTNGKGSTTHFTASILKAAGYKVGIYTSPHYLDFRERIKIGTQFISKKEVVHFVNTHSAIIQKIKPSFFEITVAMAFAHFAKKKVDVAIIEVGLGGRLDSTNIITPLLSVITNISFDHENMLGNTLKKIAKEKAGIIKPKIPVLIGEKQKEVFSVFESIAKKKKSRLLVSKKLIDKKPYSELTKLYPGPFQKKNINTALNIIAQIRAVFPRITQSHITGGIRKVHQNVFFIGRWQKISKRPQIIADSAHNKEGIKLNLDYLEQQKFKDLHFVLGFVNDKSIKSILALFPKTASYYFAKANIPRGLEADKLALQGEKQGLEGRAYSSVRKALAAAKVTSKTGDLIYVGGSIFVVAEVL